MDWLTFFASVIQSIAWPATTAAIVVLLRRPIAGLIPLLQRLKYKELEIEFGKRLEEAKEEAAAAPLPRMKGLESVSQAQGTSAFVEKITALSKLSTRAAVLEAWRDVEDRVFRAAQTRGLAVPGASVRSFGQLVRELRRRDDVDRGIVALLDDLRVMRNQAAHVSDFSLSEEAALDYAHLAEPLIVYFEKWGSLQDG